MLTKGQPLLLRVGKAWSCCSGARLLRPDVVDELESLASLLLELLVPGVQEPDSDVVVGQGLVVLRLDLDQADPQQGHIVLDQ